MVRRFTANMKIYRDGKESGTACDAGGVEQGKARPRGTTIELDGNELERAIRVYLYARGVVIDGPATVRVATARGMTVGQLRFLRSLARGDGGFFAAAVQAALGALEGGELRADHRKAIELWQARPGDGETGDALRSLLSAIDDRGVSQPAGGGLSPCGGASVYVDPSGRVIRDGQEVV